MDNRIRTVGLAALVTAWVVVTAGAGAGVTYGYLSDEATASGTIQIATGSSAPPNGAAYNDANGNGRYDEDETTYSADQLADFNDPSANLVIPDSIESIEQDQVQITAGAISYSGTVESETISLTAKNGNISVDNATFEAEDQLDLKAPNGGISMNGATVESDNGVSVNAKGGNIVADASTVESEGEFSLTAPNDGISMTDSSVTAESVSLTAKGGDIAVDGTSFESEGTVTFTAPNSGVSMVDGTIESDERISLTAKGGDISIDGASLSSERQIQLTAPNNEISMTAAELSADGDVGLESNGDIYANRSMMASDDGAITANLKTTAAALYLDGATIEDGDDAIAYQPNGVRVVPSDGPATPA
jgi:hypothetical protein